MVPLHIPGLPPFALYVHARNDRFISAALRQRGVWEPLETQVVLTLLGAGDGFVDLGANIGYYSVLAALRVGAQGRVLACEPDPVNFALLERNLAANAVSWVHAERCAVSDHIGTATLHRSADNQGDHRLYDSGDGRVSLLTPCTTLDALCLTHPGPWHLIKLDTQGSEARILHGAELLLAKQRSGLGWIVEFWPYGLEQCGTSVNEFLQGLATLESHVAILDETAGYAVPTTLGTLAELAVGGLHPNTGLFVNVVAIPRAQPERWARVLEAKVKA